MNIFRNEPLLELRRGSRREALLAALAELDRQLPLRAPALIEGEEVSGPTFDSVDPGHPETVVAAATACGADVVDRAVEVAARAAHAWSERGAEQRAEVLARAAAGMRSNRYRLTALIVRECGKPWSDADAEVCEAIDFIEYYSLQAIRIERSPELVQVPGERNSIRYVPRGLVAVIAPWNFPLAISTGMVVAGLASGNAVLYKPAEQSPGIGSEMVRILLEAGVPTGVLAFLPGGDEPGKALVANPEIHTIAFTGSCAAGLEIIAGASRPSEGQKHLKRVIAEMGGKNCLVVDSDADLDEVVPAILNSSFGFAGQKCSAASRLLALESVADQLEERLSGAIDSVLVGQAERFGVDLGPVIDAESAERHRRYLDQGRSEGRVPAEQSDIPEAGFFCPPAIVADLRTESELIREEVFAPLATLEVVVDLKHAADLIDDSRFALTAGLFTRNPANARWFEDFCPAGNLYLNRGTTGAMVGRQPFGGNRLSGTGSKAGGPGYLMEFVEPRVVCENTMRHGLVV